MFRGFCPLLLSAFLIGGIEGLLISNLYVLIPVAFLSGFFFTVWYIGTGRLEPKDNLQIDAAAYADAVITALTTESLSAFLLQQTHCIKQFGVDLSTQFKPWLSYGYEKAPEG